MKSLILHPHEVRAALTGAVTIWRPVKCMGGSCWEPAIWPNSWGIQPAGELCAIDQADPVGTYPTLIRCPLGVPGEQRFIKETFQCIFEHHAPKVLYLADGKRETSPLKFTDNWCLSHHRKSVQPATWMPQAASRLTIEVVSVEVRRAQESGVDPKQWDADYARAGFPFADNGWAWAVAAKRLEVKA